MRMPRMAWMMALVAAVWIVSPAIATPSLLAGGWAVAASQEETPTAPPRVRDPLPYRIGGSRASFERKYKAPVNTALAAIYPYGREYQIKGYQAVDVFFHRNLALAVRLRADIVATGGAEPASPGGWPIAKAEELALRFLPADTELDDATTTTTARVIGDGHSTALENTFGRATYQRYGAVGDRGDVHYSFTLDGDRVTMIELTIGDASAVATGLTKDEQAYVDTAGGRIKPFTESVQRVGTLFANQRNEAAWVNAVRAELVYWRLSLRSIRELTPPQSLTAINTSYLNALTLYASAADDIELALDSGDSDDLLRAADKMRLAAARIVEGNRALAELKALRQA